MRDQAIECAKELESIALKLENEMPYLWNHIGYLYSNLREHEQAIRAYSEAIKIQPKDAMQFRNRASEFIDLRNWAAAQKDLNEAASLDPNHPYLEGRRGDLAFWQKQFDEAARHYNNARESSEDPVWMFNLALTLIGLGDMEQAHKIFKVALRAASADMKKDWLDKIRRARTILDGNELLDKVEKDLADVE